MKKFLTIFMILLFAVLVSACKPNHGLTIADADKDLQMVLGDTYTVTPTLNVKADVLTWTSGDEEVVTVANGAIEAVGVGSTTITVVIDGTTVSETIDVTVSYAAVTSVTVTGAGNVVIGGELQLTGTVVPANASQALTWASSNNSVATVSNGVVTGVAVGTVTITATATGTTISKTANVTVVAPDPTGITVTGANEVNVGANSTFTATVAPTLASQEVTWSVDHPEFATIDATTGELTGVAEGTVVVTATSVAKNTVAGTKTVTIILPTPTSVAIEGTGLLSIGATSSNYSATVSPAGAVQTVTWSVNNPSIATINETSGVLTPISAGTVTITATSTVLNTVKATLTVVVYSNEFLVVDDGYTSLTLGTKVTLGTKDYYYGYTAFANTSDLTGILVDGSNVELKDGTYSGNVTVDKNNVKFFGKGTMTGVMSVSENVSGLTIDGLTFTQTGQVSIAPAGGVSNFTFINNHVYDTTASMSFIYFPNTGSSNSDFVIENNVFEIINAKSIQSRYIRGGNVTNVRVVNNSFEGVIGQYTDAIRLEGTNSGNAAGIGASGEIIIQNNQFASIGQRSIWITRYSATLIDISDNTFDKSGDQSYGGGVQIQVWVPGQETAIILSRNVMKNIGGSFCFRINNEATWTGAETWSVEAHYNAFFDMFDTAPYDDFIQAYAPAAASLINADYNLFFKSGASIVPATDRMPNVGSYTHQITSLDDLAEAILFDKINHSEDNLLLVGTHEKITKTTYSTLALAYEAAQPGDTILLLPGTYSGNITIDKANLSLVSLNEEKDPTDASLIRQAETIFNGKITLAKELENFTISGFRFTGTAQIVNTIGNAGTALAPATNLKGFTFANNIVETGLTTGNGFIYFVEASSSYSHDLVFANNTFKTTAVGTTLSSVVYIDNCFNLTVVGNEFKDITGKGFYIYDTTKGLSGYVLVQGNTFENITGSGFWANWLSPLPGTAGLVRVVDNQFKNVTVYGVYIGRMNNSDIYQEISVQFNTFETVGTGARFDRVHTNSNVHFNYNKFVDVPSVAYVFDEKREDTSSPVALDATKNLYMEAGIVITPNAAKFSGLPNYAEAYTEESALPVYLGEGEMMMTSLTIDPIVGKVYIDDKYQLTYSFTPEEATAIDVTWDSSDITIATVSATGELNALKTGTVTITATSVDNPTLKATIEITVYVFETIELRHEDNGVVKVGETSSLTVSTYPTTLAGTITFTSKTPAVATVDSTGAVTGVAEGTVEIEAAIGSTIVATITVIVKNDAVAEADPIQFLINANAGNALMRYISTFGNTTKTELVYGAVTKIWFGNLNIIEALAPIGNSRPGDKLTSLEFIVVHDTGNNNLGANGLMHKNYLNNSDPGVSWHYVVDDEGAYHQVPNDEVAYHAGDGSRPYGLTDTGVTATTPKPVITISQDGYYVLNGTKSSVLAPKDGTTILTTAHITDSGIFTVIGTNNNYYINNTYYNTTYKKIANQGGNRHSIGIESCVDEGSDLYGTWQRLAKLVASLLDENDLTLDRVLQHNNMSGKNCPQTLRMATLFSYFMEMVTYEYELRTTFKDYTFTFVSNDPTIVDNTGKIISKPKVTTEVSYTVTITGPAAYNQSITLYATIPGTKILG